jgi:sulfur-carrier protein adenylyltransferase/sulfurtransferase
MLSAGGFKEVYNMKGGIQAWNGSVAEGPVELNLDMIRGDETPGEIIRIAYGMEQSLGRFYREAVHLVQDAKAISLLNKLASIEDTHKEGLFALYNEVEKFPVDREAFEADVNDNVLEAGLKPAEFMEQNRKFLSSPAYTLDLAMMLEAQALDLYVRFAQKSQMEGAREALHKIASEEKAHLAALGKLREQHE